MDFHILIPARYNSERLPGKVLLDVRGKPIIQYVYESALGCGAKSVVIATDDHRVREQAEGFGASVCMTAIEHQSGTERLAEAVQKLGLDDDQIVVNVQGDEPLLSPQAIKQTVLALHEHPEASVSTLCTPIVHLDEVFDSDLVKVILNKESYALYFSRAPIPWDRSVFDVDKNRYYRHVGLYTYRVRTLKKYSTWEKSPLEDVERLEQLRILWHGEPIYVSITNEPLPGGIDNELDLERFRLIIEEP